MIRALYPGLWASKQGYRLLFLCELVPNQRIKWPKSACQRSWKQTKKVFDPPWQWTISFQKVVHVAPGFEHYSTAWGHFQVLFAICLYLECSCPCPQTGTESNDMCSALIFASPSRVCLHSTTNQQLGPSFALGHYYPAFNPSWPCYSSLNWLPSLGMAILMDRALLFSCHQHLCDFSFAMITSSRISECSRSSNEIPRRSLEPSWFSWQPHTNST